MSRVDPLPHQLEPIYEYMLKLPRVRFLLADDAGGGKHAVTPFDWDQFLTFADMHLRAR